MLGYTFAVRFGWPVPLAVAMALLLCALFGLVVERTLVRPFAERGSNGWLMATVAGGIVLDNVVLFTFGKEPRGFPSFLAQKPIEIVRHRRLSAAAPDPGGRHRHRRRAACSRSSARGSARRCWRWCRTRMPRG